MIAWYIVPYKIKEPLAGFKIRYCAIDDFTKEIRAAGGQWTEAEVLGDRAIVKVRTTEDIIAKLDNEYKRLPDKLDDSLTTAKKQELSLELEDMGYSSLEASPVNLNTFEDFLKQATTRRLKPRLDKETNEIIVDGIEQKCRSIESVDEEVKE